jgi:asparagine N-glycosylation enzyme membrane subunit Stt3
MAGSYDRDVRYRVLLFGACLTAALLACHRRPTVMTEPSGRFEDPDAMFHARRATRAVAEGTLLPPVLDRFENFPDGGRALWPPLHDATLAFLARLGGSTREAPSRGLPFAAWLPVAELVLSVLVAAAIARRFGGDTSGLAAGWLLALTPAIVRRGSFGEIDHNLTEVLFGLLLVTFVSQLSSNVKERRLGLRGLGLWAAGWGLLVLIALGFYAGLVLSAGVAAAAACAAAIFFEGEERKGAGLGALAGGFALAAALLPAFASWRVHPDPADPWRLGPTFVLLLCAGTAGTATVCLSLFFIRRTTASPSPRHDRFEPMLAGGALLTAILVAVLQPRAAWAALARGFGFIGARDPWLSTIDEFRPLFLSPAGLLAALPSVPVFLVALFLAIRGARKLSPEARAAIAFFAVPALAFLALALFQKRLLPPAAALCAVAAGAAWVPLTPGARWLRRGILAAGIAGAAQAFLITYLSMTLRGTAEPVFTAGEEAAAALVALTPTPANPPEWGVLAPWDYGHDLLTHSFRAVALDNFGSMHGGFARATRIFLETDPAKAVAELDALRLRYVLAVYPPNVLPNAAHSLGEDSRRFFGEGYEPDRMTPYRPTADGNRTFLVRLHLFDGLPLPDDPPPARAALARLGKIWESPETGPDPNGREVPFMKLFEVRPR